MNVPLADKAAIRAELVAERNAYAIQRRLEELARSEETQRRLDEAQANYRHRFTQSANSIATQYGIPTETATLILASIVAGQVPGFRASFDDEL